MRAPTGPTGVTGPLSRARPVTTTRMAASVPLVCPATLLWPGPFKLLGPLNPLSEMLIQTPSPSPLFTGWLRVPSPRAALSSLSFCRSNALNRLPSGFHCSFQAGSPWRVYHWCCRLGLSLGLKLLSAQPLAPVAGRPHSSWPQGSTASNDPNGPSHACHPSPASFGSAFAHHCICGRLRQLPACCQRTIGSTRLRPHHAQLSGVLALDPTSFVTWWWPFFVDCRGHHSRHIPRTVAARLHGLYRYAQGLRAQISRSDPRGITCRPLKSKGQVHLIYGQTQLLPILFQGIHAPLKGHTSLRRLCPASTLPLWAETPHAGCSCITLLQDSSYIYSMYPELRTNRAFWKISQRCKRLATEIWPEALLVLLLQLFE